MLKNKALVSISVMVSLVLFSQVDAGQIVKSYQFSSPTVEQIGSFHRLTISGLVGFGDPGRPVLPIGVARLLLPCGEKVANIEVVSREKIAIDGLYRIEPGQVQTPISSSEPWEPTPPDEAVYSSTEPFPASRFSLVSTQSLYGYRIAIVQLHPVEYVPARNQVHYYRELVLCIHTEPDPELESATRSMLRSTNSAIQRISDLVDNPEQISSYGIAGRKAPASPLVSATDTYDCVIITNDNLRTCFQPLVDFKAERDIAATITLIEDIYQNYQGIDQQDQIRNFIIDAYNTWGIDYVLLGGDDEIIPHRGLYNLASNTEDYDIASDLYYGALDGNWNDDGDDKWGEPGEDDLLAEVYVGRAAVDSRNEADNFVNKTIAYQKYPVADDCDLALMVGELLWDDPTWGGDSKDEVKDGSSNWGYTTVGFPEHFEVLTLYDRDSTWDKNQLLSIMNEGVHLINHLGHSNVTYNMKMGNNDVKYYVNNDGVNQGYFIIYSQGCYCNAFDNRTSEGGYTVDAIAEIFTTVESGAVAFVGNTRYGWGSHGSTNGSSQYYDREFFDALFGEDLLQIGQIHQDSKEDLIGYIDQNQMRWCYYQLCLLGDPQLTIWTYNPDPITVLNHTISDFDDGDSDRVADAAETVKLLISIKNRSRLPVQGLRGVLTSQDPHISVVDSVAYFGDVPGLTISVSFDLKIAISQECPDNHQAVLSLDLSDADQNGWQEEFRVPIRAPRIECLRAQLVDNAGTNKSLCYPGDTIGVEIVLTNTGGETGRDIIGLLSTSGGAVRIIGDSASYGLIEPDEVAACSPQYRLTIQRDCPLGSLVLLELEIVLQNGQTAQRYLYLPVGDDIDFCYDAEQGENGWICYAISEDYQNSWHLSSDRNHTAPGDWSWKFGDEDGGTYPAQSDGALEIPMAWLGSNSSLSFWHSMEAMTLSDGGIVEINHGEGWEQLHPIGGYNSSFGENGSFPPNVPCFSGIFNWTQAQFDLSSYSGPARIRFRFGSDDDGRQGGGWFIDDLLIGTSLTGVNDPLDAPRIPGSFQLSQNYPNPFNPTTNIRYDVPRDSWVCIEVYNTLGQKLATLVNAHQKAGYKMATWDASSMASGVYLYRISAGDFSATRRMVLLK